MNKERLLKLATFLDTVPGPKFDLTHWRSKPNRYSNPALAYEVSDADLLDPECGTTACAVGWACTIPEFKAAGLSHSATPQYSWTTAAGEELVSMGWNAVKRFFDLDGADADFLFMAHKYPVLLRGPAVVAQRIRNLVALNPGDQS
jgi:hypothetical protein